MVFGVMLCGLVSVMRRVHAVAMRQMRVMAGLVMVAGLVVFCRFPMMTSGVFMVLGGSTVVVSTFMFLRAHVWLRYLHVCWLYVWDQLKLRLFSDRHVTYRDGAKAPGAHAAGLICNNGANAPGSASVHCAA